MKIEEVESDFHVRRILSFFFHAQSLRFRLVFYPRPIILAIVLACHLLY